MAKRPARPDLTVTFHKVASARPTAWWEAVRRTGGVVRGGYMPIGRGVIPHDLAHMAAESVLGLRHGFWGLLALGATYRHGTRQRATRNGRLLVREHRQQLDAAERLGNHHHDLWVSGKSTPVGAIFDQLAAAWSAVPDEASLVVTWPMLDFVSPEANDALPTTRRS
ncbi:MAG TPA: hypothetical protein VGK49_02035 [Ilumatobacteraceae bacterium]